MIDTKALRSKILDAAIRGQLTQQLPKDGTAEELYQQIQKEKQKLIKAGKIKKEKPLPEIKEEDIPFEIPENWKWVRLGEVGSWHAGATPLRGNTDYYNGNIPWLKTGDLNDNYITEVSESITNQALDECSLQINPVGSVLIAMYGATIGKLGIANIPLTTNQACCACVLFNGVYNKFLFYFLMSMRKNFVKMGIGGAQSNISKEKIIKTVFPLPPLAEQRRIVEKVDLIFSLLDKIDMLQKCLVDNFAVLKSKLIDAAIQGKLTKQHPEDGTAEELLQEFIAKKNEIESSGILKGRKKKNILPLDDVEFPFQIPSNWKWVRLDAIAEVFGRIGFRGYTKDDIVNQGSGAISLSPSNITKEGKIVYDKCTYISWEKYNESPEIMVYDEDVIIVKTGSSYGKSAIVQSLPEKATVNPQLAILKHILCNRYYLHIVLNSSMAHKQFEDFVVGAATPTFSQENLANFLLPLPPLSEQRRIVERLDELLEFFSS